MAKNNNKQTKASSGAKQKSNDFNQEFASETAVKGNAQKNK